MAAREGRPIRLAIGCTGCSVAQSSGAMSAQAIAIMSVWPERFGRALLACQWGRIGIQGRIRLASDWNGWRHPGNLPDDRAAPATAIRDQAALTRIRLERNKWRYCRLVPFRCRWRREST
jgi:hypothetical protein